MKFMKKIKVLWFTNTSSNYNTNGNVYNGGGWISSLEKELKTKPNIKLGVSFFGQGEPFNSEINGVSYYPISVDRSLKNKLKRFCNIKEQEKSQITEMLNVINDFKPDLIHVFGSEQIFGLLNLHTKIPIIIHLQGLINPYLNAYFPPSYSFVDLLLQDKFSLKSINNYTGFKKSAKREKEIMHNCNFFMGRTEWDHRISKLYSPNSKYFYCSEMLRDEFYLSVPWENKSPGGVIQITSTISSPLYKGADLILKTAQILKTKTKLNFEWNVYGINDMNFAEKKTGILSKNVSVRIKGVISSSELCIALKKSHCYFHSSYIDNSPNSICEAQMIGMPVISSNVGGISSLIEHNKTGVLFPSNDPFLGASYISQIVNDQDFSLELGNSARKSALKRHDKGSIIKDILKTYTSIKESNE
jgi:glycosyltransferase involved in cell wall biosynthesis